MTHATATNRIFEVSHRAELLLKLLDSISKDNKVDKRLEESCATEIRRIEKELNRLERKLEEGE
jgi:hypothetical protein